MTPRVQGGDGPPEPQDHEHDWRVDPNHVLLSIPPQERLVCATCSAISSRQRSDYKPQPRDPKDWPRA